MGRVLAARLDAGVEGLELTAVSAQDEARARERIARLRSPVSVVPLEALAELADVVVECAPAEVFARLAYPAVDAGKTFVPISVGALIAHEDIVDRARASGARILVPSGALLGLDAVRAAAEGRIDSVRMVTRKPPASLAGAPHIERLGIDLFALREPRLVFEGTAREGAAGFPANVNVAAALGLAGTGPDDTRLEIWADPGVTRNTHQIIVEADSVRFEMKIENVPSEENPRTGKLVAHSVMATLRRLVSPLVVGT